MKTMHVSHGCCGQESLGHAHAKHQACCGLHRQYTTKAERKEALESYRDQLKLELTGVEERLAELA